jgi:lipoyl synthase
LVTKSGLILGMGETDAEVRAAMADLRSVGVGILTIGQYLRPSADHVPVAKWWHPDEFAALRDHGEALGFAHVESGPLVRSSYHAREGADRLVAAPL